MAFRYHSRAEINPWAPRATGTCDRCGFFYPKHKLRPQMEWAGTRLIAKNILVCETCMLEPSPANKTTFIPPDPLVVLNARPEAYDIDETDWLATEGGDILTTEASVLLTDE